MGGTPRSPAARKAKASKQRTKRAEDAVSKELADARHAEEARQAAAGAAEAEAGSTHGDEGEDGVWRGRFRDTPARQPVEEAPEDAPVPLSSLQDSKLTHNAWLQWRAMARDARRLNDAASKVEALRKARVSVPSIAAPPRKAATPPRPRAKSPARPVRPSQIAAGTNLDNLEELAHKLAVTGTCAPSTAEAKFRTLRQRRCST